MCECTVILFKRRQINKKDYNYLENEFHGLGDESKPATIFLRCVGDGVGGAGGGSTGGRVDGDGSVSKRVEKAFESARNRVEINGGVEGVDWRNLMEAEFNSGRS